MGLRVLIVDDEVLVGNALARVLKAYGHAVNAHTRPTVALSSFADFAPQIVLSDLHMPEMRGTDFLLEVKRRHPEVLRGLVSAFLEDVTEEELRAIEPCALITKPWSEAALRAALQPAEGSPNK
jgi:DNA-binding response OmpR family regulator